MSMTSAFVPITKSVDQEDGTVLVYGKATDGSLDRDSQRCDPVWLAEAMPAWYSTGGNVREQHDAKRAVGKAIEHEIAPDGHYVTARIVDPVAVAKTKAGVFTGFSIGIRNPKIGKSADAPNGLIHGGEIVELSLCDRPSNPECLITLCKSAKPGMQVAAGDFDAQRLLVRCEELVEKSTEPGGEPDGMTVSLSEQSCPEAADKLDAIAGKAAEPGTAWAAEVSAEVLDGASGCGCCNDCICSETKSAEADVRAAAEFDRDAARKLVAATLAKADSPDGSMPPEYNDEQSDIVNAQSAIGIISKLIVSEAQEMCDNPAEDCDIQILLSAVSALRCFIGREQEQAMGADVVTADPVLVLGADADITKAKYSSDDLQQMLKAGKAFKNANGDPSYPIADKEDLENAIHAVGRGSGDHDAIRAYISRRAKALGASDMIPDNWAGGSNKAADSESVAADETIAKAATVGDTAPDSDTLTKAFSVELEKSLKKFEAIVEASTETTAKSLSDLSERLVKVEQMAVPGGPSLRRTEVERTTARKNDLVMEAARFKALANGSDDENLRKGYDAKAKMLEAEFKSL